MAKDRHGTPHLPLGALCVQGTQRIFWGGESMVGAMEMEVGVKLNLGSVISGDNHEWQHLRTHELQYMLKLDGFLVAGKKAQDIEPSTTFLGLCA